MGRSIPQAARSEEEVKRAFKIVEEEELKAASRARPDEELRKFFVSLRRKGFRLGLVTMQASRSTILVLRNMDLADLFDVIVTREYSLDRREQLVYALKKLGVKGGDCVFLGLSLIHI
ncbi:MAG: HAD hydrolase-like protein, partial [Candidatus Korarchaeota archaeon]|nr:HAD hydrolase-like protein [Candidatus Korarchaeota archaeon]